MIEIVDPETLACLGWQSENDFDLRTPGERVRRLEAAIKAVAQTRRDAEKVERKARTKRAAAAIPKAVKAARAAGLSVARVDVFDDGGLSIVIGEPVAAPEGQGGRSRLDDLLGT